VIVLLVRHARAGERAEWEGDDRLRPLDEKGLEQARRLVELLDEYPIGRILSSPFLRCTQTVEPLADARTLAVEEVDELAEGRARRDVVSLLSSAEETCIVLCTHGDVVEELLDDGLKKGATEVLELQGGRLTRVRHLERPT